MSVWSSVVTKEMTAKMTGDEIELLIADLDDAIQGVLDDYKIEKAEEA